MADAYDTLHQFLYHGVPLPTPRPYGPMTPDNAIGTALRGGVFNPWINPLAPDLSGLDPTNPVLRAFSGAPSGNLGLPSQGAESASGTNVLPLPLDPNNPALRTFAQAPGTSMMPGYSPATTMGGTPGMPGMPAVSMPQIDPGNPVISALRGAPNPYAGAGNAPTGGPTARDLGGLGADVMGAVHDVAHVIPHTAREAGQWVRGGAQDIMNLPQEIRSSLPGQYLQSSFDEFLAGLRGEPPPSPFQNAIAGHGEPSNGPPTRETGSVLTPEQRAQLEQEVAAQDPRDFSAGGGGGPAMMEGGGGGGGGFGPDTTLGPVPDQPRLNVPKPTDIPQADYGPIHQILDSLKPNQPEMLTKEDKLLSVLGGLAAGARGTNPRYVGDVLTGAGAGGIGGMISNRQEDYRRQQQYDEDVRRYGLVRANQMQDEIGQQHEVTAHNIEAQNNYNLQHAMAEYEYQKAVMPKTVTNEYGTTFTWRDPKDGMLKQRVAPGPAYTLGKMKLMIDAAQIRQKNLAAALGGGKGKVDFKYHFPNLGDVDLSGMGPDAIPSFSSWAWAETTNEGKDKARAYRQDVNDHPEKYPEAIQLMASKPDEFLKWSMQQAASFRLAQIYAARNANPDQADQLVQEGLAVTGSPDRIMFTRMFPMMTLDSATAGDSITNALRGQ